MSLDITVGRSFPATGLADSRGHEGVSGAEEVQNQTLSLCLPIITIKH